MKKSILQHDIENILAFALKDRGGGLTFSKLNKGNLTLTGKIPYKLFIFPKASVKLFLLRAKIPNISGQKIIMDNV